MLGVKFCITMIKVEVCGEMGRANPLETPEVVVARVYATSVNLQVSNLFLILPGVALIIG